MKIFKSFCLFLLAAFFLSGCIEVQTLVNVNKDGSGTLEEKVLFSKEMIEMFSSFNFADSTAVKDSAAHSPFYNVKELKSEAKNKGEGVRYISSKEIKEDGREGYVAVYGFKNINKIKVSESPESKASLGSLQKDENKKKEYLTFNFKPGTQPEIKISMPKGKFEKPESETEVNKDTSSTGQAFAKEFLGMMKDFKFSLAVNVKGKIVNTNATYVDGSRVTLFDVEFGKLLENKDKMDELNNLKDYNLEKMKELLKGMPGVKIELNNPVTVKFE